MEEDLRCLNSLKLGGEFEREDREDLRLLLLLLSSSSLFVRLYRTITRKERPLTPGNMIEGMFVSPEEKGVEEEEDDDDIGNPWSSEEV